MTLSLIKLALEETDWRKAGSQAAIFSTWWFICPFVFDVTPGTVTSTLLAGGLNHSIVQKIEGNMTSWPLGRNSTFKLTTPTWRLAICALSLRALFDSDYQERKNGSPTRMQ